MTVTHKQKGRLQKKVAEYLNQLRTEMRLSQWHIDVLVTEYPGESDSNHASIAPVSARHRASLEVSVEAAEAGGALLRQTLTHELLHLYHRDASDQVRLGLINELSSSTHGVFWELYRQSIEIMVDDLAYAWSEYLPLPDWPEEKNEGDEIND